MILLLAVRPLTRAASGVGYSSPGAWTAFVFRREVLLLERAKMKASPEKGEVESVFLGQKYARR